MFMHIFNSLYYMVESEVLALVSGRKTPPGQVTGDNHHGFRYSIVLVGVRKTPPAQVAEVEGRSGGSNQMWVAQGQYQG